MELGRLPIKLNIFKSMLKYWFRILTLPKTRLVAHCYWALYDQENIQDDWISSIKNIIGSSGFSHIWDEQKTLNEVNPKEISKIVLFITKSFEDQFLQNAQSEISEQKKLYLYKNIPQSFTPAPHLSSLNSRKNRSLFTKLRLGNLKLEIETGRWVNTDSNQRLCKLCTTNQVENEPHFLFDCPALSTTRNPLLEPIYTAHPKLHHMSSVEKTKFIFFNDDLNQSSLDNASILLKNLVVTRESLVNQN